MKLILALVLFFIFFVFLFFVLKRKRYRAFSAFFLTLLASTIFLIIIYPPTSDEISDKVNSKISLYFFILISSVFVFIVYALTMALNDYDDDPIEEKDKIFSKRIIVN